MRGHAAILAGCRPGCSKDDPSRIVGQGAKSDMAGVTHWSGWRIVSALAFVAVCGILVFSATTRGAWDWDVIGYTMAVLKDGTPDVALHAKTWALVKQWVPAEALADLIYRDSYRQTMHATPAALISQLPLYESKLGYVLLLKALSPVADPIGAMRAVSLVCTLGILLVLFCECWAIRGVASLAWLPFVGLFGLSEFATMLSPDPVATLPLCRGLCRAVGRQAQAGAGPRRPRCLHPARRRRAERDAVCGPGTALARTSGGASSGVGSPMLCEPGVEQPHRLVGAVSLQLRGQTARSCGTPARLRLSHLFFVLAEALRELLHQPWFQAAVGAVILALALLGRGGERLAALLLLAIVAATPIRFIVYPSVEMRHYGALLFGLALIVLHALRSLPKDRPSPL